MSQPDDRREEFALDLTQMLDSPGWQKIAEPVIRQRLAAKHRALETGHHPDLAAVQVLQAEIKLLRLMLTPREFFKVDTKKGPG